MKKLLTFVILIASCGFIARADFFDMGMDQLVQKGLVNEIHVSKPMLELVSPQVRNKIPLLGKVDGITAVSVYTLPDSLAVRAGYQNLSISFSDPNGVTRNLLTNSDGKEYVAIYGTLKSEEEDCYNRIIMFTNDGKKGQIVVVYGTITPEVLAEIARSVAK